MSDTRGKGTGISGHHNGITGASPEDDLYAEDNQLCFLHHLLVFGDLLLPTPNFCQTYSMTYSPAPYTPPLETYSYRHPTFVRLTRPPLHPTFGVWRLTLTDTPLLSSLPWGRVRIVQLLNASHPAPGFHIQQLRKVRSLSYTTTIHAHTITKSTVYRARATHMYSSMSEHACTDRPRGSTSHTCTTPQLYSHRPTVTWTHAHVTAVASPRPHARNSGFSSSWRV